MNLERAFHLAEGGYQPAWPLVLGRDLVSRAIWDKEEDKANGITWTFAFLRTLPTASSCHRGSGDGQRGW